MGESKKVFVIGSTGYVGREVMRLLAEKKIETIAHVRSDSHQLILWKNKFESINAHVDTTPWEQDAFVATLKRLKPDVIFSLLGTTRARMKSNSQKTENYESVDYGLTALLINSVQSANIHPRFVYLSSTGVNSKSLGSYLKTRWKVEELLRQSGLTYTIVRPAIITGEDRDIDRPAERLGAVVFDSLLNIAGVFGGRRFKERYHSTTNTILAKALIRHALDSRSENKIIESENLR